MSPPDFAVPIEDRYFEDYLPGAVYEFGSIEVTEAEIIDFARRWDPQDDACRRRSRGAGPVSAG